MSWACVVSRRARSTRVPAGSAGAGAQPRDDAVAGPEGRARPARRPRRGRGRRRRRRRRSPAGSSAPQKRGSRPPAAPGSPASSPQISRPSGAVAEERLLEEDLAVLGRVVEVGADLLDDDRPLLVDLRLVEQRPDDQLAEDVHGAGGLAARHADPVDGGLAIGGGVGRAADALDRLGERAGGRVARRALEGQVLHEVGARRPARAPRGASRPARRPRRDRSGSPGRRAEMTRGPSGSAVRSNIGADGTGNAQERAGAAGPRLPSRDRGGSSGPPTGAALRRGARGLSP